LVAGRRGQLERAGGFWGVDTGPNPTDRAKKGTKHHLIVDGGGIPLNATVTAANRNDVTQLVPLVAGIKLAVAGADGEDRMPARVLGDRAYRSAKHHAVLRWLGTEPVVAAPGSPHGSGLGRERYVVEQTIAILHQNRRLKVRYEKRSDIHKAFLTLACIKLCAGRLLNP